MSNQEDQVRRQMEQFGVVGIINNPATPPATKTKPVREVVIEFEDFDFPVTPEAVGNTVHTLLHSNFDRVTFVRKRETD